MKKVLVTGGSGFIGTNLVEELVGAGYEVLNLDIVGPRKIDHDRHWQRVDILNVVDLEGAFQSFRPDFVFHLAARTDLDGKELGAYKANTDGVRNVVQAARSLPNLERIIFASSMLVCEIGYEPLHHEDYKPSTWYGESKVLGEKIVRKQSGDSLPWVIVRPTSIWGPWFSAPYRDFFDIVKRNRYVHPKGVRIERSYGFVLNAIAQMRALSTASIDEVRGKVFFIADYTPIRLIEWAELIRLDMGVRPIREVPLAALWVAAKCGDLLRALGVKGVPIYSFRLQNILTSAIFDTRELEEICGPLPYNAGESVNMTVKWLSEHNT